MEATRYNLRHRDKAMVVCHLYLEKGHENIQQGEMLDSS